MNCPDCGAKDSQPVVSGPTHVVMLSLNFRVFDCGRRQWVSGKGDTVGETTTTCLRRQLEQSNAIARELARMMQEEDAAEGQTLPTVDELLEEALLRIRQRERDEANLETPTP
jgi:hypothetical protein